MAQKNNRSTGHHESKIGATLLPPITTPNADQLKIFTATLSSTFLIASNQDRNVTEPAKIRIR